MIGDIFEIYFNEHVLKMRGSESDIKTVEDEFLFQICSLLSQYGEKDKVSLLLQRVAATCVSEHWQEYNMKVCAIVGSINFEKQLYSKAYTYYLRANDIEHAI